MSRNIYLLMQIAHNLWQLFNSTCLLPLQKKRKNRNMTQRKWVEEDGYMNMPDEYVPRQSTRTTLSGVAHGGPNGGTATFSISGDDKLVRVSGRSLPVTVYMGLLHV